MSAGAADGRRHWLARHWPWLVPLVLALLLALAVGLVALVFMFIMETMRSTPVYETALERARADERVVAALGEPIEPAWLVEGSYNVAGAGGHADLRIPVTGPRGAGRVHVVARRVAGEWVVERLDVEVEATGEVIDVRAGPELEE